MNSSYRRCDRRNERSMTCRRYGGIISRSNAASASALACMSPIACVALTSLMDPAGCSLVATRARLPWSAVGQARFDVLHQRPERLKVCLQILRLIDHEPEALLDANRQLDEVE